MCVCALHIHFASHVKTHTHTHTYRATHLHACTHTSLSYTHTHHLHVHTHTPKHTHLAQFSYFISLGYTSLPVFRWGKKKRMKNNLWQDEEAKDNNNKPKPDQHIQTTSHLTFHQHIKIGQGSCLWVHALCIHMTRLHWIEEIGRHTYVITAHMATHTS